MKKQLFTILSCAVLTLTAGTIFGTAEKDYKKLENELKKQTELAKNLSQKVDALSSKKVGLLFKEAINKKVEQLTNSPYIKALFKSRISHFVRAAGWSCIVGAAIYFWINLNSDPLNDPLLEHDNGFFVLGSLLIGIPNMIENLHAALATQESCNE